MNNFEFGKFIAEIRSNSGYKSQRQLSLVSGISTATLSRIEAGIQKPIPDTLKILSNHLRGITYEELMSKAGYINENYIIVDQGHAIPVKDYLSTIEKGDEANLAYYDRNKHSEEDLDAAVAKRKAIMEEDQAYIQFSDGFRDILEPDEEKHVESQLKMFRALNKQSEN